jgi:hypothetical protein
MVVHRQHNFFAGEERESSAFFAGWQKTRTEIMFLRADPGTDPYCVTS